MSFAVGLLTIGVLSALVAAYLTGRDVGRLSARPTEEQLNRVWEDGFRRGWWKSLMRDAPATDAPKGGVQ